MSVSFDPHLRGSGGGGGDAIGDLLPLRRIQQPFIGYVSVPKSGNVLTDIGLATRFRKLAFVRAGGCSQNREHFLDVRGVCAGRVPCKLLLNLMFDAY